MLAFVLLNLLGKVHYQAIALAIHCAVFDGFIKS